MKRSAVGIVSIVEKKIMITPLFNCKIVSTERNNRLITFDTL